MDNRDVILLIVGALILGALAGFVLMKFREHDVVMFERDEAGRITAIYRVPQV